MAAPKQNYYDKRSQVLVKNLQSRGFEAYYCQDKIQALEKALALIPEGSTVGWGGCLSAQQIGLIDAIKAGKYQAIDRNDEPTPEGKTRAMKRCLTADVFLCGANGLSLDGQMVSVDGNGNRVAAMAYGPDSVIVIAGMNKVCDTLDDAMVRARTVAAPMNQQRFCGKTPCTVTGSCGNCKSPECICNQILITRNCRPAGRIKFVLVGEELGF